MSSPVEQIKARLSIQDVIGSYIKLEKAGSAFKARCPFHDEKTPSFHISPARGGYYCFGCNRGGDIFTFVQEIEGVDFRGALKILADRAGVVLTQGEPREVRDGRDRLKMLMAAATDAYAERLARSSEARTYLLERGLSAETIEKWKIGLAPGEWREMVTFLKGKGYTEEEVAQAGLAVVHEKGAYDRFRSRIMFPIFDAAGAPIAFSGRVWGSAASDPQAAKYINSPEGPLYDKSSVLFGYDRAKLAIRKQNFAVLVEGQMDLIMAHQAGTENAVAVSGTALTETHLGLIRRLTENVILALDADEAGQKATERAFHLCVAAGLAVRVAVIPEGKDPADVIRKDPALWHKALAESKHIMDYAIGNIIATTPSADALRDSARTTLLPLLASFPSTIEQEHFLGVLARALLIPENALRDEFFAVLRSSPGTTVAHSPSSSGLAPHRFGPRELFLGIVLWLEGRDGAPQEKWRTAWSERLGPFDVPLSVGSETEANELSMRAEATYSDASVSAEDALAELLDSAETDTVKARQADLWGKIVRAEEAKDKESATALLSEYRSLAARLVALEERRLKRGSP